MEFHLKVAKDDLHIFWCDPNDINIITYNQVKLLCAKYEIDWKNQIYMGFATQLKNKFFDELNGRVNFSKEQRRKISKPFDNQCNVCK